MSTNLYSESLKDFLLHGLLPVVALISIGMLIVLPLLHFFGAPEPSQPECRVMPKTGDTIDIRCTLPTEESQPPKINTSLRRA